MTPERVTERVAELIETIHDARSDAFAEHNASLTIDYIEQVHTLGIIDDAQFEALVIAVNDAADTWQPTRDDWQLPPAG
jgi:hypothetical protein